MDKRQDNEDVLREEVNKLSSPTASIDDRVVSMPDAEEYQPSPQPTKPIISIHGEDVERRVREEPWQPPEGDRRAA